MADGWSVPIVPGVFTGITDVLAQQGKDRYNWLGQLPDAYWAGQNQGYQQNLRNLFQGGLPQAPGGGIDYGKMGEAIIRAGGAPAIQSGLGLLNFQQLQQLQQAAVRGGLFNPVGGGGGGFGPSGADAGQFPPSTARPAGQAQAQAAATPESPAQDQGGAGPTGPTIRNVAQRFGADPNQLAAAIGASDPDALIDPNDPRQRAALAAYLRRQPTTSATAQVPDEATQPAAPSQTAAPQQSIPQGMGPGNYGATSQTPQVPTFDQRFRGTPTAPPPQGAPVTPVATGNFTEAQARAYDQRAAQLNALATFAANAGNENVAKQYRGMAEDAVAQAKQIREVLAENQKLTPSQKEAYSSGVPSPLRYEGLKEDQKQDIDLFGKENDKLQNLGRAAIPGIEKAQLMKNFTLQPGFYSGPLSQYSQTYNQFKSLFGNPSSALPQEAMNKVANDMLIEQIRALGGSGVGRVLMAEVNSMKQAIANLGITPASNRAILEMGSRVYQHNQDIAQIATSIPNVPGQKMNSLNQAVNAYLKQHPLFTAAEMRDPALLGAPDAPPASINWTPQQKRTWATSIGLKTGDAIRIRLPNSGASVIGAVP